MSKSVSPTAASTVDEEPPGDRSATRSIDAGLSVTIEIWAIVVRPGTSTGCWNTHSSVPLHSGGVVTVVELVEVVELVGVVVLVGGCGQLPPT